MAAITVKLTAHKGDPPKEGRYLVFFGTWDIAYFERGKWTYGGRVGLGGVRLWAELPTNLDS